MFRGRSAIEILVITFTLVIASGMVFFGGVVVVVEVTNPEADTDAVVDALSHAVATILGALLGLLARGPLDTKGLSERPPEKHEDEPGS